MTRRDRAVKQLMAYVIFGHHRGWPVLVCRPDRVEGISPHAKGARGPLRVELDERSNIAFDGVTVPVRLAWRRKGEHEQVVFVPWEAIDDVEHGGVRPERVPLRWGSATPFRIEYEQQLCPLPTGKHHGVYCGCAGVKAIGVSPPEQLLSEPTKEISVATATGKRVKMSPMGHDGRFGHGPCGFTDWGPWIVKACDCGMCKRGTHVVIDDDRHISVCILQWAD